MNPLVSILIPVYNRENLVAETIESAINQTYKNIEIVIVDNCSTDGTWELLQEYAHKDKRIRIFQNTENIGPVRNWKRCIDEATGEYGKILWSDDLIAESFIEKSVPYLRDYADVGFVLTGIKVIADGQRVTSCSGSVVPPGFHSSQEYIKAAVCGPQFPVSPGCALFRLRDLRKNLVLNIPNNINSDFSMHAIGPDLLIFLLTANDYDRYAYVDEHLAFFRNHEGSISTSSQTGLLTFYYFLVKASFLEHHRTQLVRKFNALLFLAIQRHSRRAREMGLSKIRNFYTKNQDFSVDIPFLIANLLKRMLRKVLWTARKATNKVTSSVARPSK